MTGVTGKVGMCVVYMTCMWCAHGFHVTWTRLECDLHTICTGFASENINSYTWKPITGTFLCCHRDQMVAIATLHKTFLIQMSVHQHPDVEPYWKSKFSDTLMNSFVSRSRRFEQMITQKSQPFVRIIKQEWSRRQHRSVTQLPMREEYGGMH